MDEGQRRLWQALGALFQSHPWHGVSIGPRWPEVVTAYIEIVPTDTVKYEMEKLTGLLKIDRPQKYSNVCPNPYGLVPQTYCDTRVAELVMQKTGRAGIVGDGDPLDICVITEKAVSHGNILVEARPIGGLRMLDGNEADDKIIAVLSGDAIYGAVGEVHDLPPLLLDRLLHYFLTYKQAPDRKDPECEITHVYGREEAHEVIRRSHEDYLGRFSGLAETLAAILGLASRDGL
jgi:inorganic pyrophosphatase